jgi:hypothetical protein
MTWDYFWTRDIVTAASQEAGTRIEVLKSGDRAWLEYKDGEIAAETSQTLKLDSPYGTHFFFNTDKGATWPQAGTLELYLQGNVYDKPTELGWQHMFRLNLLAGVEGQRHLTSYLGFVRCYVKVAQVGQPGSLLAVGL